jgi:hypothetical protein
MISAAGFSKLKKILHKKNKFNAKKTLVDGISFHSKAEANYYSYLKHLQATGIIAFFLRQTPIHLPGNTKYLADFLIFYTNGNVRFVDVKGRDTPTSILKRKQVEALYPITIEIEKV